MISNRVFILCIDYRYTILIGPEEQGSIRTQRPEVVVGIKLSFVVVFGGSFLFAMLSCTKSLLAEGGKTIAVARHECCTRHNYRKNRTKKSKVLLSCVHLFVIRGAKPKCCCVFCRTSETLTAIVCIVQF